MRSFILAIVILFSANASADYVDDAGCAAIMGRTADIFTYGLGLPYHGGLFNEIAESFMANCIASESEEVCGNIWYDGDVLLEEMFGSHIEDLNNDNFNDMTAGCISEITTMDLIIENTY